MELIIRARCDRPKDPWDGTDCTFAVCKVGESAIEKHWPATAEMSTFKNRLKLYLNIYLLGPFDKPTAFPKDFQRRRNRKHRNQNELCNLLDFPFEWEAPTSVLPSDGDDNCLLQRKKKELI